MSTNVSICAIGRSVFRVAATRSSLTTHHFFKGVPELVTVSSRRGRVELKHDLEIVFNHRALGDKHVLKIEDVDDPDALCVELEAVFEQNPLWK